MIIDLRKLRQSGKDGIDFSFDYNPTESLSTIPGVEILLPIKIIGRVDITGKNSAFVEAEISFNLKGQCTRCLKETEKSYVFTLEEEFFDRNYAEEDDYIYVNDKLDLTKAVYDAILFNMPINFLCSEDCVGIDY